MLKKLIRLSSYPLILGICAAGIILLDFHNDRLWPWSTLIALAGVLAVGLLERFAPFEPRWLQTQDDVLTDLWHNFINLSLIQFASVVLFVWTDSVPTDWRLWPTDWPFAAQLLIVAVILDLSLYVMHRLSHDVNWLWKLHAIHHSPERLYWLNGERRHPVHALLLAAPGLTLLAIVAAPQNLIAIWFAILTVHLAFQHSNLDYTLGPLRKWLGVAEVHRWHHKREFEDAQVNYGEFFMIWDRLFGTFYAVERRVNADELGLRDRTFPRTYWGQLKYPFTTDSHARSKA
jgi:sterol desaturase/sphingolipid hydroxylase (fatty acid hydroxylase superfamily)